MERRTNWITRRFPCRSLLLVCSFRWGRTRPRIKKLTWTRPLMTTVDLCEESCSESVPFPLPKMTSRDSVVLPYNQYYNLRTRRGEGYRTVCLFSRAELASKTTTTPTTTRTRTKRKRWPLLCPTLLLQPSLIDEPWLSRLLLLASCNMDYSYYYRSCFHVVVSNNHHCSAATLVELVLSRHWNITTTQGDMVMIGHSSVRKK